MKYIILQQTASSDPDPNNGNYKDTYYPTTIPGYKIAPYYQDVVGECLKNAQAAGFKVFIGLNLSSGWPNNLSTSGWFSGMVNDGISIADEIYKNYQHLYPNAFYGWYFPWEVDNVNFSLTISSTTLANVGTFTNGISTTALHLHYYYPGMPIMMSPFIDKVDFSGNPLNPSDYATTWKYIFTWSYLASGDIFCPQDSVGSGKLQVSDVPTWFQALETAIASKPGMQFWSDTETFAPATNQIWPPPSTFIASTLDRVVQQLAAEQPIVTAGNGQIVFFSWSYYDSPTVYALPGFQSAYQYYLAHGVLPSAQLKMPGPGQIMYQNGAPTGWQFNAASDYASILGYKLTWQFSYAIMLLSPIQYTQASPPYRSSSFPGTCRSTLRSSMAGRHSPTISPGMYLRSTRISSSWG
jgi:hypothetical protein